VEKKQQTKQEKSDKQEKVRLGEIKQGRKSNWTENSV
jgi:hypothetical protein